MIITAATTVESGLSRRKGSSTSRSGAGKYALVVVVCLALPVVLVVMGFALYTQTQSLASLRQYAATHPLSDHNIPNTILRHAQQEEQQPAEDQEEEGIRDMDDDGQGLDLHAEDEEEQLEEEDRKETTLEKGAAAETPKKEIFVLSTRLGEIRIVLQPQYSQVSIEFLRLVVKQGCDRCTFHRAEKRGILQGVIQSNDIPKVTKKGDCPPGAESVPNQCPKWDTSCTCHGPVMERGYVGWAAGQTGPDFFIDDYRKPATHWGTQHTVWGIVEDEASFDVVQKFWDLPAKSNGGLTMLLDQVPFAVRIETDGYPAANIFHAKNRDWGIQ